MTDYAELRAALDAGPTPGPWEGRTGGLDCGLDTDCAIHTWERCIAQIPDNPLNQRDMAYIAACHPEAIRALLAERDALIHDNSEYVSAANELATENQRLREAVTAFIEYADNHGEITFVGGGMRAVDAMNSVVRIARAALAQGQGEKHDIQD